MPMKKKVSIKMQDDFEKPLDNMFAGLWLSISKEYSFSQSK